MNTETDQISHGLSVEVFLEDVIACPHDIENWSDEEVAAWLRFQKQKTGLRSFLDVEEGE